MGTELTLIVLLITFHGTFMFPFQLDYPEKDDANTVTVSTFESVFYYLIENSARTNRTLDVVLYS